MKESNEALEEAMNIVHNERLDIGNLIAKNDLSSSEISILAAIEKQIQRSSGFEKDSKVLALILPIVEEFIDACDKADAFSQVQIGGFYGRLKNALKSLKDTK